MAPAQLRTDVIKVVNLQFDYILLAFLYRVRIVPAGGDEGPRIRSRLVGSPSQAI